MKQNIHEIRFLWCLFRGVHPLLVYSTGKINFLPGETTSPNFALTKKILHYDLMWAVGGDRKKQTPMLKLFSYNGWVSHQSEA